MSPGKTRIEALVDGNVALEGVLAGSPGDAQTQAMVIAPTYVRAGLVECSPKGIVKVRARGERDASSDEAVSNLPELVQIDPSEFSELWLDGRLVRVGA